MMKCNYKIYESSSGSTLEEDKTLSEQLILAQVKQSLEEPKRIVIRPKVKVWKDAILLIGALAPIVAMLIILREFTDISGGIFTSICLFSVLLYLAVSDRKLLLTLITFYQKYAPEFVRSSCLFEPCCSEYMRISVLKYGAFKGFLRGIKRISRCRYPNGGIDEP